MGVSFKVSKTGTRFRSKPLLQSEASGVDVSENSKASSRAASKNEYSTRESQNNLVEASENIAGALNSSIKSGTPSLAENEASFTLKLFPDGYSIGKPSENETANQSANQDVPKLLHPYDRTSESLFSAIESGHLPGDILDDIPCKYVDGALTCEVRDYRRCSFEKGPGVASADNSPTIIRVRLRMSLENVVKDIPLISDNSWTYGDLMEVESQILKALRPQLHLDPTPKLDWLCESPVPIKLNLSSLRRKRLRQMPELTVTSKTHGKKVCIDRVLESSTSRSADSGIISTNAIAQHPQDNLATQNLNPSIAMALRPKSFVSDASIPGLSMMSHHSRYQMGIGTPRSLQEHGSLSALNTSGASPAAQDIMISYADNENANGRRENQEGQTSPLSNFAKRMRPASAGFDTMQQQQISSRIDGLQGSDLNWQNSLLQQQAMSRGIQYVNTGTQKFPQQALEKGLNPDTGAAQFTAGQQVMRITPKEEPFELEKLDASEISRSKSEVQIQMETNHLDPQQSRLQQRFPQHPFMRSNLPQATWNNPGQHMEKEARKDDQLQKRKPVQSPRLSSGTLPQSPLSSKSGEFSNGSVGPNFGSASAASALGASQKEKTTMSSVPAAVGASSLTSSANDSTQRQYQAQLAAKRRPNSLPKTQAMSGVGSPVSVSNVGVPLNVSSPSFGAPASADQNLLERFSKIEMVTMRYQLNHKKNKVDNYPMRKQNSYSPQHLVTCLSNASNGEDLKDDASSRTLSKSLEGGSMNICKIRVLNFVLPERVVQGNSVSFIPKVRTRMIMSEKPSDGTVAMHYGDIDDGDFLAAEDHLPTLPNTHFADLLAAEFSSQMARDGYVMEDDRIQPKPNRVNLPPGSQASGAGVAPNTPAAEMQQYGEPISGQSSNDVAKPTGNSNASLNPSSQNLANTRIIPPGNPQALQMSQGLVASTSMAPRSLQLDPQQSVQQHQQLQQQQQQQQQQQLQQNQHSLIQQQNPQFQRSPMMLGTNPLSHLNTIGQNNNIQLGNHMINKPSPLHIQLLQQQQQQQQQPQMQRKMMMGLGTAVGMSNMRNNMVGLGGLGSPINMGTARGMGGTGISAPMTSISGMGSTGQNPMSLSQTSNISNAISQQFRSGSITPAELLTTKLRMAHNRASMLGASQSGIAGISGARQMHPSSASLSMLGQSLNRANMMQRAIGPMGPPKLMAGMNLYMTQEQQQQQQQQQQLQLQQQQQFQPQLQQQQETTSPLQAVVSPPQVGSPSTMGVPSLNQQMQQQQASPQQMNQRTPMSPQQMSSGAIHAMSTGNPEACPASPQLSSQTLGSVSSITNSPMDMQGVNKSNSVNNA